MASSSPSSIKYAFFCPYLALFLISFSLKEIHGLEKPPAHAAETSFYRSVDVKEILASASCKPSSSQGDSSKSSLKIVDRNGACYEGGSSSKLSLSQILNQDQSRAFSIQSRHGSGSKLTESKRQKTKIPGISGVPFGTGNYIVNLGLGTPKKSYSFIFDTGSDLTWTQCLPCLVSCYQQQDPIFDPSKSSTYSNISCSSPQCSLLVSGTGFSPGCFGSSSNNCVYSILYGDRSFSQGFFANDTLTIGKDVFRNFLFGCGQNNQGLFGQVDGLLGLGPNPISLVSQTAKKYGKVFSYCLPTFSGSDGYLRFGKRGFPKSVKYTPFFTTPDVNFYIVDIVSISVGGRVLPIDSSVFQQSGGTIVDSGTVITRLPPAAYGAMRDAFKQQMINYTLAPAFAFLDTCYDFTGVTSITIPKISFSFKGKASVDLGVNGILIGVTEAQVCLAFAGNAAATDPGIFGNIQQQTLQVVYDVAKGKVGFGPRGGCS